MDICFIQQAKFELEIAHITISGTNNFVTSVKLAKLYESIIRANNFHRHFPPIRSPLLCMLGTGKCPVSV